MTENDTIRKRLDEINYEKMNNTLSKSNPIYDSIFYKIDNKLKHRILDQATKEYMNKYIGELLYYESTYYEQLIVNLGIEFKLRSYQLSYCDRLLKEKYLDDIVGMSSLLEEFENRVSFVLSRPLLDIYDGIYFEEKTLTNNYPLYISLIKNYINELLKMMFGTIRDMVFKDRVDKDSKDTLSFIYHSYYLENQQFQMDLILDEIWTVVHTQDDSPWTREEEAVYDFMRHLGNCLVSPASDPLRAYYG